MTSQEIAEFLVRTRDAGRLSRNERRALAAAIEGSTRNEIRETTRHRAFELARATLERPEDQGLVDWLEDVVKAVQHRHEPAADQDRPEVYFSPGDACWRRIVQLCSRVEKSLDICVFTITDDRIAGAILDAHRRGIPVRVITDNEKAYDEGSAVTRLSQAGVAVRVDNSPYHMHHKFAVFDGDAVLTGSYNWTRGASEYNEENLVVLRDRTLIAAYRTAFERLWSQHDVGAPPT
jgi:cardiolipin hydrolase